MSQVGDRVDVHGVKVGYKRLYTPNCLPNRLADFIDGGLGGGGLGSFLRTLNRRISEQYTGGGDYSYRDEIIHLSDINYCLAKGFLRRKYPDWIDQFPREKWNKNFHLKRGSIISSVITSLFPTSEKDVSYPLPDVDASLTGRLDFVSGGICYELKRSSDFAVSNIKKKGPYPYHIAQIMFYSHCRQYKSARLLYFHSHGMDVYELDLENRRKVVDKLLERASTLHKHLKQDKVPEPEPDYGIDCDLCAFGPKIAGSKALCTKSGEGMKVSLPDEEEEEVLVL